MGNERNRVWDAGEGVLVFECPGCGYGHAVHTQAQNEMGAKWGWNGSMTRPTFTPSILVFGSKPEVDPECATPRCHSFVTDGRIQFLADCGHDLRNTTVDLPEVDPSL